MTTMLTVGDDTITIETAPTTGRTLKEMTEEQANARRAALAMKALESEPIPGDFSVRQTAATAAAKETIKMLSDKKTRRAAALTIAKPALATPVASPALAKTVISPDSIEITVGGQPRVLTTTERDMVAAVLNGKISARTPKTTAPRSTRPTVCTVTGVDKALGTTSEDGDHDFPGWTASFVYCTDLVRKLKAAGIKTSGNYKDGVWTAVHDGAAITITNERPASAINASASAA